MKIEEFRVRIKVYAPAPEVWNELVTWKNQGKWMALTRVEASHVGPADSSIGTTIEAFTGIGKFGILDRMKVIEWNPPKFCKVDHYGRFIKGIGTFELTEENGVTVFDWFEEIKAPKALLLLLKPFILIAVYASLRKFARGFSSS
jgi:hypothetical protein